MGRWKKNLIAKVEHFATTPHFADIESSEKQAKLATQSQITRYVKHYLKKYFFSKYIKMSIAERLEREIEKVENLEELKIERIKELQNPEIQKL